MERKGLLLLMRAATKQFKRNHKRHELKFYYFPRSVQSKDLLHAISIMTIWLIHSNTHIYTHTFVEKGGRRAIA